MAQFGRLGVNLPEAGGDSDVVEVWDVNWLAFEVFSACATQWRVVAGATAILRTGLDYAGVEVVMRRFAPAGADRRRIFRDLLEMETAALPILNEVTP